MNPIIKWPGGKSGEIARIRALIPEFDRYIEPFFGGGALYFYLEPQRALINDNSKALMDFYRLIQRQEPELRRLLMSYSRSFAALQALCRAEYPRLHGLFLLALENKLSKKELARPVGELVEALLPGILAGFPAPLVLYTADFAEQLRRTVADKLQRTVENHKKRPFSDADLERNLITGFTGGYYMYFRAVYNDIRLGRLIPPSPAYEAANFYFIREYCYGSMFRYNARGEFNIPYGGMSYNEKNLSAKIEAMFTPEMARLLGGTEIACADFEDFLGAQTLTERDFLFLDPPYDTDFSDYEGKDFSHSDQARLAQTLRETPAKFILIIKSTPFILSLYEKDFHILSFDNRYTYNVRSRNNRSAEHLIITNYPVEGL